MGLPFSGKDKISKDTLKKQLVVAGKLLESFAEIESFNNLIQRIKDVADDPDATWITQFESDVKSKVIHPQYFDDTFFRDYAELVTSNGIDNIPEWEMESASEIKEYNNIKYQFCKYRKH